MRIHFALLLLLSAATAGAATRTWTGAAGEFWSNPANWAEGVVPVSGDALVFPPYNGMWSTNDLPNSASTPFQSLTVTASNLTVGTYTNASLVLTDGLHVGPATSSVSLGFPVRVAAPQTWRCHAKFACSSVGSVTVDHTLTVEAGPGYLWLPPKGSGTIVNTAGRLSLSLHNPGYTGDVLANGGSVDISGSANPGVDAAANGGVLELQQTVLRSVDATGGTVRASRVDWEYPVATIGQVALRGNARLELSLNSVSETVFEIRASETEGTDGTITLQGVTLVVATPAEPGQHFLPPGKEIQLFDNDSDEPVNGIFEGLPNSATFRSQNGQRFRISYTAHDGNDVVITALAQYDAPFDLDGDGKADVFWRHAPRV